MKLYGDNGGRKVERHVSAPFDLADPKVEYETTDRLDKHLELLSKYTNADMHNLFAYLVTLR